MVQFKKDTIARCFTHKSKCVIYLWVTVGEHCRVFPLHRMYNSLVPRARMQPGYEARCIWACRDCCHNLVLDIRLDVLAWQCMNVATESCFIQHISTHAHCCHIHVLFYSNQRNYHCKFHQYLRRISGASQITFLCVWSGKSKRTISVNNHTTLSLICLAERLVGAHFLTWFSCY